MVRDQGPEVIQELGLIVFGRSGYTSPPRGDEAGTRTYFGYRGLLFAPCPSRHRPDSEGGHYCPGGALMGRSPTGIKPGRLWSQAPAPILAALRGFPGSKWVRGALSGRGPVTAKRKRPVPGTSRNRPLHESKVLPQKICLRRLVPDKTKPGLGAAGCQSEIDRNSII